LWPLRQVRTPRSKRLLTKKLTKSSGKSSLIATILRLLEVTPKSTLTIDNANLTRLPRQTIRSHITALPQDPFHISGTVRFNLDPEGAVQADSPLINALQMTSIWSIIDGRGGLDAEMDDLGFSVGQMQLFCLARVLLRRSKVVLLDEATSSVDRATDDEVREAIKANLEGRTVVEVAHRVEIVKKYDVVVTMAEGRIVEVGSPDELLEKPQGLFRALWESK
jgi:ABC-type multidrug transport system fused ATPase/permease subunit